MRFSPCRFFSSSIFHPFPRQKNNLRSGITVLELVSSMALFIIVLGTLMVAINTATDIWTRSADRNRAQQKVRQALDQIVNDLTSAIDPPVSGTSSTPGPSQPLFIAETNNVQISLSFIRALSPVELTNTTQVSLQLVAYSYCWASNSLSRYSRAVVAATPPAAPPDLRLQFDNFRSYVAGITTPFNVLSSAIVHFEPLFYQPLNDPAAPINSTQEPVSLDPSNLKGLPDFVDVLVGFVSQEDWTPSGYSATNYMTRRVNLLSAQASRLP